MLGISNETNGYVFFIINSVYQIVSAGRVIEKWLDFLCIITI